MSCYGKSDSPAVDLSRTLCNRMIANGGREKEWGGKKNRLCHNLPLLATRGVHQKGQASSLKWSRNANKFTLLSKHINITPTQVIKVILQIQKNRIGSGRDIHNSRALDSVRVTNPIRF